MTPDGRTSEAARQSVHVLVGGLALALAWLTWQQAVVLGIAGVLFNLLVLPRIAPQLFRPEDGRQPLLSGIVQYPAAVLGLILLFPSRLDLAAIAWVILAAGDGMATLVGAHLRTPRLPWNHDKSIGGLIAFLVFGGAAAVATAFWMQRNGSMSVEALAAFAGSTSQGPFALVAVPLLAATAAAFVETVPIRLNDNISVPAAAALVLWSCAFMSEEILGQVWALMPASRLWTAVGLNVVVAALGYWARTVTIPGAVAGAIIGTMIYVGAGLAGWQLLFAAFLLAAATTRLGLQRKTAAGIAEERGGRRGAGNAIANTGLAALAAFVALGALDDLPVLALVAALATSASDTVASEVGKAWGRTTWLVVGFRRVPPGTSGAISLQGTLAGVLSALFLAWLAEGLGLFSYEWIPGVVIAATIASMMESVLGATLERDGTLNNDALNFVNSAIGAGLALMYVEWL